MISMMSDPSNEPCPGPVAIHVDGGFECTALCEGVRYRFHDEDSIAPCPAGATEMGHTCDRCAHVGGGDGLLWCPATEIEHEDGTVTCELGDECAGTGAMHASGMSCSVSALAGRAPCERCS